MLAENGLEVDLNAVNEVLQRADVLTIGFTVFPERLLVDARTLPDAGPLIAIVGPVASVQERYLWLGKHRGQFPAPQGFSFFMWPHTVRNMIERNVLRVLRDRLRSVSSESDEVLEKTMARLLLLEEQAFRNAILGVEPWQALWKAG